MLENTKISKATPEDIPALIALINSAYRGESSKKGWTTEANLIAGEIRTDDSDLRRLMENPQATFLKYSEDGKILGSVYLRKDEQGLYLGMLSVNPDYQANGIGKQLLQAAEAHAKEKNCVSIFMQVLSARTELIDWYVRHGYQFTGEKKGFDVDNRYGTPTQKLEFIFLQKKLQIDIPK
jgi:ribosomal protein S18 acetylase RimI-like enzyme